MNKHTEEHITIIHSITEALFQLMEKKPFSEITPTEIINRSGVARSTYYRNFSSKDEIVRCFFLEVFKNFKEKYPVVTIDDRYTEEYFLQVLDFLKPYTDIIRILNKSGASASFLGIMNEYLLELHSSSSSTPVEIFRIYAMAGIEYNLIFNWYPNHSNEEFSEVCRYLSSRIRHLTTGEALQQESA